jgi:hypothetical protein
MTSEAPPPAEFTSVFFTLADPRPLRTARGREKDRLLEMFLRKLDIQAVTAGFSILPNNVVQLIVFKGAVNLVSISLREVKATVLPPLSPQERCAAPKYSSQTAERADELTVRRLAYFCRQSRSRRFQEEVLQGMTEGDRSKVLEEYRRIVNDPNALLGHEGRWYNKGKGPEIFEQDSTMEGLTADKQ